MIIYTIGHSNHEIGKFIDLLKNHNLEQVVDVRSVPFSRFNPQFNQKALRDSLNLHGITYIYAGEMLGGRPKDASCYKYQTIPKNSGNFLQEIDYAQVMKRDFFQQGIQQLLVCARQRTTAVMCSEENPARCHRHHLITKYLLDNHPEITVLHIRNDAPDENALSMQQPELFSHQ